MSAVRKRDAISELLEVLKDNGKIDNTEPLLNDICEREKSASTGIGYGIAIPHKIVDGLEKTIIAFGRKKEGSILIPLTGNRQPSFSLYWGKKEAPEAICGC